MGFPAVSPVTLCQHVSSLNVFKVTKFRSHALLKKFGQHSRTFLDIQPQFSSLNITILLSCMMS